MGRNRKNGNFYTFTFPYAYYCLRYVYFFAARPSLRVMLPALQVIPYVLSAIRVMLPTICVMPSVLPCLICNAPVIRVMLSALRVTLPALRVRAVFDQKNFVSHQNDFHSFLAFSTSRIGSKTTFFHILT